MIEEGIVVVIMIAPRERVSRSRLKKFCALFIYIMYHEMGGLSSKKSIYFRSDFVRIILPPRVDCENEILSPSVSFIDTLVQCEDTEGSLVGEVRLNTLDLVETLGFSLVAEGKKAIVVGLKHSLKLLIHCLALLSGHVPWLCITHFISVVEGFKD